MSLILILSPDFGVLLVVVFFFFFWGGGGEGGGGLAYFGLCSDI